MTKMLRFLLNKIYPDTRGIYEIVEFQGANDEPVLFAKIECSEIASQRIIRALNATSTAGSASSAAKAAAARINGAKGGRPRLRSK